MLAQALAALLGVQPHSLLERVKLRVVKQQQQQQQQQQQRRQQR
jgi:hypothetical protein